MTTRTDALATVYARSLLVLAEKHGGRATTHEIAEEIEQICELVRTHPGLREILVSPVIPRDRRGESLRRLFEGRITNLVMRFLLVLNARGRLEHLERIGAAFGHLVQEAYDRIEVDVVTPAPLSSEALDRIGRRVQEVLGKEPVLTSRDEPSMLGGLRLRIGDRLFDGSVATRLRRLGASLLAGGRSAIGDDLVRFIELDAKEAPG